MSYLHTFAARAGVIGNQWALSELRNGITRNRGGRGVYAAKYAPILAEKLQALADARWRRAVKWQRKPTPKQAAAAIAAIDNALRVVQSRCRERLLTVDAVRQAAHEASFRGRASRDGGRVTANSYGYRWTTTRADAHRRPDGTVTVTVSRDGRERLTFPAKLWTSISAAPSILAGGGVVAIRAPHGFDCYNADGSFAGVAVKVSDARVSRRWTAFEHGRTVAEANAETARKAAILDAEAKHEAEKERRAERLDRAARLLTRIGIQTTVGYAEARAAGACENGLRAFSERTGLGLDTRLTLPEVARLDPVWALRIARQLVAADRRSPANV